MWLQTRKKNALLAPLVEVVDGQTSDGRLKGVFAEYAVEAWPHSGFPIKYVSSASYGSVGPKPVNMLRVVLAGVAGRQSWHCQSSASSYLQDLTSRFTAGPVLKRFKPGQFKFEGVDTLNDGFERMGEKLTKRLGVPIAANADPALQERLVEAGLFDVLEELRSGGHPYLPKAAFTPPASEIARQIYTPARLARLEAAAGDKLRDAGYADLQSLMTTRIKEADQETPGALELDVEMGKERVPTPEEFREVLDRAVRIAELNVKANPPTPQE
jgi:hypothetical protein